MIHQITQNLNEHHLDEPIEYGLTPAMSLGGFTKQQLQGHVQGGQLAQANQHDLGQGARQRVAQPRPEFKRRADHRDVGRLWQQAVYGGVHEEEQARFIEQKRRLAGRVDPQDALLQHMDMPEAIGGVEMR